MRGVISRYFGTKKSIFSLQKSSRNLKFVTRLFKPDDELAPSELFGGGEENSGDNFDNSVEVIEDKSGLAASNVETEDRELDSSNT